MTPDTHFNLVTQLPAVLSPLYLSRYLSFSRSPLISISLDPLLPLSCLLPYPSFIPRQRHFAHRSPPLLSITRVRHNWCYYPFVCWIVCPFLSSTDLYLSLFTGRDHPQGFLRHLLSPPPLPLARCGGLGLHAAVNPAASAWLTPATSLAGQPEVSHTGTHKGEQTPDAAMTKPMPKSCGIKAIQLGKPLERSSMAPPWRHCMCKVCKVMVR